MDMLKRVCREVVRYALSERAGRFLASAILAFSLSGAPSVAADGPAPQIAPNAESFILENGLQVVVIPDHRAPVVTHMVWYKVGAADEEEGKSGLAHFLEHLMFKGTSTHPAGEFDRRVSSLGGEQNAFTSSDYTAYYQRLAKEHLPLMMSYEADRMQNLVLTDANVIPERKVVLEERSMRTDGNPMAQLDEAVSAVLYLRHPYGVPIIGWRDEIEALTKEDAIAFYNRHYTPNNAILVVAGDVTADEVKRHAEDTYGKVPRRADPPPRVRPKAREIASPRVVSHSDPIKVTQESFQISWLVPSYRLAKKGEAEAFDVLSDALGGSDSSLLYEDLVVRQRLASSLNVDFHSTLYDMGQIVIYAVPREGVTLERMQAAVLEALPRIVEQELNEEELKRAKSRLIASTIYAQDSQMELANIFGASLAVGLAVSDIQNWPAAIQAVSLADVKQAAARLDPAKSVAGTLRKPQTPSRS